MVSSGDIFGYFAVFFISTLIAFAFVYNYYKFKIDSYRPDLCIERILARCAPVDNSEKLVRDDLSRSRGGLSFGAEKFFSEENRDKIISRYVKKGSKDYSKIRAIFTEAFNRKDEEMLICLEKHITTYNNEPSCENIKEKKISTEQLIVYFSGAFFFGIVITIFCHVISTFFL